MTKELSANFYFKVEHQTAAIYQNLLLFHILLLKIILKKIALNKILARQGCLASLSCFYKKYQLRLGNFNCVYLKLSFWRCELLKNDGISVDETEWQVLALYKLVGEIDPWIREHFK